MIATLGDPEHDHAGLTLRTARRKRGMVRLPFPVRLIGPDRPGPTRADANSNNFSFFFFFFPFFPFFFSLFLLSLLFFCFFFSFFSLSFFFFFFFFFLFFFRSGGRHRARRGFAVVVRILALIGGTAGVGSEIEEGTLVHLLTQDRWSRAEILIAK